MKTVKGLFFDLDGTLVDTIDANFKAYEKALQLVGRKLTREMYVSTYGMRVDEFLHELYGDMSEDEIQQIMKNKALAYLDFLHLSKPNHKLINFVKTLRPHHTTALVTTAQKANAQAVLTATDLLSMFDHIITGDMVEKPKPNPEAYLKALELSGLEAHEVLAFEDSETGKRAADAAGILTLGIQIASGENL